MLVEIINLAQVSPKTGFRVGQVRIALANRVRWALIALGSVPPKPGGNASQLSFAAGALKSAGVGFRIVVCLARYTREAGVSRANILAATAGYLLNSDENLCLSFIGMGV